MPEITILVAKQPMDKIPASLILFSKFLIIIIVCLNFNESFYIAALAPPVAGAATVLVAMAAPPTIPPIACPTPVVLTIHVETKGIVSIANAPSNAVRRKLLTPPEVIPTYITNAASFLSVYSKISISRSNPYCIATNETDKTIYPIQEYKLTLIKRAIHCI